MATTKRKLLTSCKINFADDGTQTVEVAWANQTLEDGVVQTSSTHAGAYVVDPVTGNPDQSAQTIMGIKLSKLLSNAGDNAQAQLLTANANLVALQTAKDAQKELTDQAVIDAKAQRDVAKQSLNDAKTKLAAAKQEKQSLRKRLNDNNIDDSDIPIVDVGDTTPVTIESVKVTSFKI